MRRLLLIALILGVATIALALFAMFSVGSRVSPRNAPIVASSPATPAAAAASAGGSPAMQPLERYPAVDGPATVKPDVEFALQFSLTENMPASPRNAA